MLRVTKHDDVDVVDLKLEGKLAGCWVDVVEQCWKQALQDSSGKRIRVDLTAVAYVDGRGINLLNRMHGGGASLHAATFLAKGIVEDIQSGCGEPAKTAE